MTPQEEISENLRVASRNLSIAIVVLWIAVACQAVMVADVIIRVAREFR